MLDTRLSSPHRERGFTMIELLVVALVVSIITAVGVPTFVRHRANAKVDAVRSDAEQAGLALTAQVTGSGILPAALDAQGSGVWGFKPTAPNTVAEYKVDGDRFRICLRNSAASPTVWAIYASSTQKVTTGTGTEPTGACDGNTAGPDLDAEPVRGASTPIPTPTPTPVPTVCFNVVYSSEPGGNFARWTSFPGATGYHVYVTEYGDPAGDYTMGAGATEANVAPYEGIEVKAITPGGELAHGQCS